MLPLSSLVSWSCVQMLHRWWSSACQSWLSTTDCLQSIFTGCNRSGIMALCSWQRQHGRLVDRDGPCLTPLFVLYTWYFWTLRAMSSWRSSCCWFCSSLVLREDADSELRPCRGRGGLLVPAESPGRQCSLQHAIRQFIKCDIHVVGTLLGAYFTPW